MTIQKNTKLYSLITAGMLVASPLFAGIANAATSNSFDLTYQYNQSEEAGLLATAKTLPSTDPKIADLATLIQGIETQITALYTTEQALSAVRNYVPHSTDTLVASTNSLKNNMKKIEAAIHKDQQLWGHLKAHNKKQKREKNQLKGQLNALKNAYAKMEDSLGKLENEAHKVKPENGVNWTTHPFDSSIPLMQATILHLQTAAVHYTKEWIYLASSSSTVTGSTYSQTTTTWNLNTLTANNNG